MAPARRKKIPSGDHCMSIVNNPLDGATLLLEEVPSLPSVLARFFFVALAPFPGFS
jgi:hypothetical protein